MREEDSERTKHFALEKYQEGKGERFQSGVLGVSVPLLEGERTHDKL